MNNARDVSNAAVFTYATSKLDAAASLSASYHHDLSPSYNLGFISTAYTAAHEGMELLLKVYLKRGSGFDFNKIRSHDLGELFMLWDKKMRTNAELAYQRGVLKDIRINRIFRAASQATLNLDRNGALPPDYKERKAQYNEAFRQYQIKLLYEDSPTVRDVVRNLDVALGARNITWICKPAYASKVDGFPCEPEVWYPDDFLSMEWEQFSNLVSARKPLLPHEFCDAPPSCRRGFSHGAGGTDTTEVHSASSRTPSPMFGHRRPCPSPCAGPGGDIRR